MDKQNIIRKLKDIKHKLKGEWWWVSSNYGFLSDNAVVEQPLVFENQSYIYLEKFAKLRRFAKIVNSPGSKFVMKKFAAAGYGLTVVTGNHHAIMGLPHYLSASKHIRDSESDIIIEEAAWLGVNVTLLHGAHIGRGAFVGAGAIVNKPIPPYAVAVGIPAKVVASVFTLEQIFVHEELLYPEEERFSREYLENLFETYYKDKKSVGLEVEFDDDEISRLTQLDNKYNIGIVTKDYNEKVKSCRDKYAR